MEMAPRSGRIPQNSVGEPRAQDAIATIDPRGRLRMRNGPDVGVKLLQNGGDPLLEVPPKRPRRDSNGLGG
jgi:hypothetical protein